MSSSGFALGSPAKLVVMQNNTSSDDPVIRTACLNPDFLNSTLSDSTEPVSRTDSEGHVSGLGYIPSPVKLSGVAEPKKTSLVKAPGSELPSVYDLRKEGRVTVAKDQGMSGSCWSFSSFASLESYLLGTEGITYDFSENNMKNLASNNYSDGFDLSPNDGGNAFIAAAYLSRWTGPVSESEDPYFDMSFSSPIRLSPLKHVQEILFLPERKDPLDNEYIKKALMNYGAVYTTLYWYPAYYQDQNYSYLCTENQSANHAVTIVGWDDSFDKNRFKQVPLGNGAFIVKNSWGKTWGEEGYFYVSYYDFKLGHGENAVFTAEKKDNYDEIYQYDPLGWTGSFGYKDSLTAWGGNIFSSKGNETLRAVGFYTTDFNTAYDLYVYRNPASGPVNSRGLLVRENGTYSLRGYHTKVLSSTVNLRPGEKYSVVVKFTNPSNGYPLAVEQPVQSFSTNARANPRESYMSLNGRNWEDISSNFQDNLCIKAFTTTNELPEANFTSDITSGNYPLTVHFTDLSKNAFSWEWDLNGDGIVDSTDRNPTYTYSSDDNYTISQNNFTVSLKVSNRNGPDSEVKTSYVKVAPLTITSANPEGSSILTLKGERQEFNVSTNYMCNVSWYLNGELKNHSSFSNRSYYNDTLTPGFYSLTALAEVRNEKDTHNWNWTVHEWNRWETSTSTEGRKVSTAELQEAIHLYQNGLQIPETGAAISNETLKGLITNWREK
jgi:C1A family cysteine protease